jgi:molybdate transport system substrate-binding protein
MIKSLSPLAAVLTTRARRIILTGMAVLLLAACASPTPAPPPEPLLVSAASNLMPAFEKLAAHYKEETGRSVTFNFAARGQLAHQIEQGAPVDLFVSADVATVQDLADKGRVLPDSVQVYARGSLILWTRADSGLTLESLEDLLRPEVKRVAIANPDLAPYGAAARQALQEAGVWEPVRPKLVFGENVRQTLQFAETGDAEVAIVPLSLGLDSNGQWVKVPEDLHDPVDQSLGIVADSPRQDEARAFAYYVTGPEGRAVLREYGYSVPEEIASP